ncbi:ATPase [Caulobacter sp. Root1455]|uniref:SRPBCC family protein n=1 Tax=unclassified Caulobacter TaxID=2648921 RepID=UPI0006FC5FE8|nr:MULTISPECIES: SRPBCC domain-containing protein [unclassified Caulobacter]KQY28725.1 ATPase [Caulobacter sp. Root487D2Y]KQY98883.1 ATPase [Caulobacter sp. Root1455]
MTNPARSLAEPDTSESDGGQIVVDEVFPHAPQTVWKALTNGALMGRWLMAPTDFAPVEGHRFTFQTTPGGQWDGVIRCQVLEVAENERFAYAWSGGHEANVGYGAPLETVVTWTLTASEAGTRVRMVHSGFVLPRNATAFEGMGKGWKTVMQRLETCTAEQDETQH